MPRGALLHLPEPGGALEQSEFLLESLWLAWRVWYINVYLSERQAPVSADDQKFMEWVLEGYIPAGSQYDIDPEAVRLAREVA